MVRSDSGPTQVRLKSDSGMAVKGDFFFAMNGLESPGRTLSSAGDDFSASLSKAADGWYLHIRTFSL